MRAGLPQLHALRALSRDGWLLFQTRFVRLFGYGLISVVLALYLEELGLSSANIGMLLSLTLVGDIVVSLVITTRADRVGRRRMLILGAALVAIGGVLFAASDSFVVLLLAATIAVISPSGGEVGPFLPIEQAALAQIVPASQRMDVFAWYNLVGSVATAFGALAGGLLVQGAQFLGFGGASSYTPVLICYAAIGGVLAALFLALSPSVEPARAASESGATQLPSAWIASFAAGSDPPFVAVCPRRLRRRIHHAKHPGLLAAQTVRHRPGRAGAVFLGANLLAGVSALAAGWLARRIGLLNTMVFTHLPSNVLLILVPLMPTAELAVAVLLLRFSISQMDVPTRQAYTMAVVAPDERAAASGITTVARSVGSAISPALATRLLAYPALMSMPFFLAGGIKIVYDLILWRAFVSVSSEELDQMHGT